MKIKAKKILLSSFAFLFLLTIVVLNLFQFEPPVRAKANEDSITVADKLDEKIIENVDEDADFLPNRVIVVLDKSFSSPEGLSKNMIDDLFGQIEYTKIKDLSKVTLNDSLENYYAQNNFRQILCINLEKESKENVISVIQQLQKMDEILYVGPDYLAKTEAVQPSDPYYENDQWGLNGTFGIDIEDAWDITIGSQEVSVGIIDTGIAYHEDLYTQLDPGYDFYNENNTTTDDEDGHGTHVAGIVAAAINGKGIVGTAPYVKVTSLQTSYWNSEKKKYLHTTSDLLEAIGFACGLWGTPYQLSVLNFSIGGFGESLFISYAVSQFPGLFVWAAGNGQKE